VNGDVRLLWLVPFLVILGVQLWATAHYKPAQLSRTVWAAMSAWWFRTPFVALWAWLTWHWILEPVWFRSFQGHLMSDLVVILAGGLLGWASRPIIDKATDDEPKGEP